MRQREGAARTWGRTLWDLARSAPLQHAAALRQDFSFAWRKLAASPGTVALVILTIAAGAGVNVANYSSMDALLFRPLPVDEPEKIVAIGRGSGTGETSSYFDYRDYRDRNTTFSSLSAAFVYPALARSGGSEERRMCGIVSGNYFNTIGIRPLIGRFIEPADDGAAGTGSVAVLSYKYWKNHFGGDTTLEGKTVVLNDLEFSVIGVAQEDFHGTLLPLSIDIYAPISMHRTFIPAVAETEATRDRRWLSLLGRLKEGVTVAQAEANLNAIEAQIQADHPALAPTGDKRRERRLTAAVPHGVSVPHIRRLLQRGGLFMMVATGLLLLLACVNIAGILLARAASREREVAVRIALGASRRKIIRELLAESLLLGLAGVAASLPLAYMAMSFTNNMQTPLQGPWQYNIDARLDGRVLAYALALAFLTSLLFGLAPAFETIRRNPNSILKGGASGYRDNRRGARSRQVLVIGQFSAAVALLAATGLLTRSLLNLYQAEPGFETDRQASASLMLLNPVEQRLQFMRELKRRAGQIPGVEVAALAGSSPYRLTRRDTSLVQTPASEPGRGDLQINAASEMVDGEYFSATGIALMRGRGFLPQETESGRAVAIVNRTLADRLWPEGDAIGRQLKLGPRLVEHEVVGVVRDSKYTSLAEDPQPFVYTPLAMRDIGRVSVIVRTSVPPGTVVASIRSLVRKLDPVVDVIRAGSARESLDESLWPTRMAARILSGFSLLAMVMTAAGLFGLMAHHVEQRRHEIGLRMALGSSSEAVARVFLMRGARLAGSGVVLGIASALAVTRLMAGFLSGVSKQRPLDVCMCGRDSHVRCPVVVVGPCPSHRASIRCPRCVASERLIAGNRL